MVRGSEFEKDAYHLVVHACVFNAKGEMLIQQIQYKAEEQAIKVILTEESFLMIFITKGVRSPSIPYPKEFGNTFFIICKLQAMKKDFFTYVKNFHDYEYDIINTDIKKGQP